MSDSIKSLLNSTNDKMSNILSFLDKSFSKIAAGKANPSILDGILVDYYGSKTYISQMSSVTVIDSRTLQIKPWDKSCLETIDKSIQNANIGLVPVNKGDVLLINIPQLTKERREELVKQAKAELEKAKISIRSVRKSSNEELKKLEKEESISEDLIKDNHYEIDKITRRYMDKSDEKFTQKEKDITTI